MRSAWTRAAGSLLLCAVSPAGLFAQKQAAANPSAAASPTAPDYSIPAKLWPIRGPYQAQSIPDATFANASNAPLEVIDGKIRLSLAQVMVAAVENNLAVAGARYYPSAAQTDLLRARSGQSPRGVDQAAIPSGVFAGAAGGSILAGGGGGGGFATNAGGITGGASQVVLRPSGVFDPQITASLSVDRTPSPLNTLVVAGVPKVTTNTEAFSVSYVQAFPTGSSFTASYSTQRLGSSQLHLLFDPALTSGFTATFNQQLLNGFGRKVNTVLIKVAENEQGIERESFRQQVIAVMASAEDAYWDVISAREAVKTAEQALSVARQLALNNQKAFDAGVMARLDVVNAQAQEAASQRDLVVAQTNLEYVELQLKTMISTKLEEPFASASIEPMDGFPDPESDQIPSLDQAIALAQKNRPEISIAQGNMQSEQDALPFIRNSLLPSLNAYGLVTTSGLYGAYGNALLYDLKFKYPQFAIGVSLSFSLRNRQAQADQIRSRLEMRQSEDTLTRTQRQVSTDVQTALVALTQSKAQVRAAREAIDLEQQKTDAEKKKLTAGLSTSYNVILVERDLFSAQLAEVQARDTYAKAKVALNQAMGLTLDNAHINLDEALRGTLTTAPSVQ